MDYKCRKIELYASFPEEVMRVLDEKDCYFVELKWISHKYGTVKDVFLNAYRWYVQHADSIVEKPEKAESAVWTFLSLKYIERHSGNTLVKLCVPMDEAVFFRMSDWNKILNLRFVGQNEEEESAFSDLLERNGIEYEGDIYNMPYYPKLKKQLVDSWNNLFRFDEAIKRGGNVDFEDMQAGLWCIRKEWVVDTD